ncbi:MAG: insulinase family protein, partial [Candidatus Obscuribacterales bacterium]|nr:insulinase family protein [Candidatus Obscuribacterales bacterium]
MRLPTQTMKKLGFELVRQSKTSITLKYVKNGMTVVLMPDKLSTVVTSNIIYMVGSRHEGNGETGAAHLFEHLMFKETAKHNKKDGTGFDDLMKAVGAEWNATTYYDRTHYYEVGSPDLLELFMQIESDRMRGLILRKSDLDSEMPVVLQEFARGENNPRSALNKEVWSCAFKEHPYKMETIGSKSDVFGVPMERLQAFYDKFYWPNNAILVIFGKLEMSSTLKLIAKYFGHIPASPKPIPTVYTVEPKQEGQKRAILRRAGDNEIVQIAFHTPKALHPDTAALAVAANILGSDSSRNSRLYKRLLKEKQLANDFGTSNLALHDSGMFEVVADVMQDSNVQEVEGVLFEEIYKLKTELVSDEELNLNKQALCKGLTLKMVDNEEKLFYITESIASASLESLENRNAEIKAVTKEDILRVANVYFLEDNSTVGHFLPKKSNQQTNEDSEESQFAESDQESQVQKDNQAPQEVKDKIEQDNCAANQF